MTEKHVPVVKFSSECRRSRSEILLFTRGWKSVVWLGVRCSSWRWQPVPSVVSWRFCFRFFTAPDPATPHLLLPAGKVACAVEAKRGGGWKNRKML